MLDRLRSHYGGDGPAAGEVEPWWWPRLLADSGVPVEVEVLLGAVLVQRSRWERVEQVLLRLAGEGLTDPARLAATDPQALAPLLVGAAYPAVKAGRLVTLAQALLDRPDLLARPDARDRLLALPGLGPETADTVLGASAALGGGGGTGRPVVDLSLRRVLGRTGVLADSGAPVPEIQAALERALPRAGWWPLHVLVVEHGVHHCTARHPRCHYGGAPARVYADDRKCAAHCAASGCAGCPLAPVCPSAGLAAPGSRDRAHPRGAAP